MEACLDKIDVARCDNNVKWGYFNLRASNLMLLEENIDVVEEYKNKLKSLSEETIEEIATEIFDMTYVLSESVPIWYIIYRDK